MEEPGVSADRPSDTSGDDQPAAVDAGSDQDADDTPPPCPFDKGQRVFARDMTSGLLYQAVVRRCLYGMQQQRQLHLDTSMTKEEMDLFFRQEPEPNWHCFVHYLGWNVKWDRWVACDALYELSEGTRDLAKRLQDEVRAVKAKHRKTSKSAKGAKIWVELEKRMKRLEQARRAEERREELAQLGVTMEEAQVQVDDEQDAKPEPRKKQWTKAAVTKELALREASLQGRRRQTYAEKLVLPFTLKKIMVDEWEVITQCNMLPNLPASVTVQTALDKYLSSKLELLAPTANATDDHVKIEVNHSTTNTTAQASQVAAPEENDEVVQKQQEWNDMVQGIEMLFDQSAASFLLYRQELPQLGLVREDVALAERRPSELYGCEHLLRFFVHLPALLAGQLNDIETRPIYSKLGDLIRFLQKHQSSLFAQSYHPVREDELEGYRKRTGRKRKASPIAGHENKPAPAKTEQAIGATSV